MRKFWFEIATGMLFLAISVLTVVLPNWLEVVAGVDPDGGNGSAEWFVVAATALLAIASFTLAGREWRHRQPAQLNP